MNSQAPATNQTEKSEKIEILTTINNAIELILKTFSLLFLAGSILGTLVLLNYLEKIGSESEIISLSTSPQILISAAIYSALIAAAISIPIILMPVIIDIIEDNPPHQWKARVNTNNFWTHLLITSTTPLIIILTFLISGMKQYELPKWLPITMLLLISLVTSVAYTIKIGLPEKLHEKIANIVSTWLGLLFNSLMALMAFLVISKAIIDIGTTSNLTWGFIAASTSLIFFFFILSTLASSAKSKMLYIPTFIFSSLLSVFVIFSTQTEKIAATLGIGGYKASYVVDSKNSFALIDSLGKDKVKINPKDQNTIVLDEVWVLATLPDKIILTTKEGEKAKFAIHTKSIIGEVLK